MSVGSEYHLSFIHYLFLQQQTLTESLLCLFYPQEASPIDEWTFRMKTSSSGGKKLTVLLLIYHDTMTTKFYQELHLELVTKHHLQD